MTQQKLKIHAELKIAWWLQWYLFGVFVTSKLTQRSPDWQRVASVMTKAVTVKISYRPTRTKISA